MIIVLKSRYRQDRLSGGKEVGLDIQATKIDACSYMAFIYFHRAGVTNYKVQVRQLFSWGKFSELRNFYT